jgi:NitT/TauT family transport system ATP-binding protein
MESSADALIDVRNVTVRFDRRDPEPVIDDVSLQIRRGELVALIGPSGCGKSTLLNMAAGLVRPTEGEIHMADKATVAYVFQRPRLLPWRNVMSNVEYGLQARGASRHAARQRAKEALELVNLKGHDAKYPHQLSGGMQQRVALARGLAIDPAVCLLDEPFGALDALTRSYLQEELLGIVRGQNMTTLLVTHDIDEALLLADRILVMTARPGKIRAEIPVPFGAERTLDILLRDPEYPRLRSSLRAMLRPEVDAVEELVA